MIQMHANKYKNYEVRKPCAKILKFQFEFDCRSDH